MFGGGLGGMIGREIREDTEAEREDAQTENMMTEAAEKTARDDMTVRTADLTPESWDFSDFAKTYDADNFTRGQLSANDLANYSGDILDDDTAMDQPATEMNGKIPEIKLQMLAFANANHADYDAKAGSLSFAGGALEINYLEGEFANLATDVLNVAKDVSYVANPLNILTAPQTAQTDAQKMAGRILIRAKLSRNVPNMIVNPSAVLAIKLPTGEYVAQKIATEGGNDHFNIFVSPDYQDDALQIFTPDVLAVMERYGVNFAYKFYDDEVEIYAASDILKDGEKLRDACLLAVGLAKQINAQAAVYRDDRATNFAQAHDNLATTGRRMNLKSGFAIGGGVVIGLLILWRFVLPLILNGMVVSSELNNTTVNTENCYNSMGKIYNTTACIQFRENHSQTNGL